MKKTVFLSVLTVVLFFCISALAWEKPCVDGPYDGQFEDGTRSIHVQKFSENQVTYFVADVQLTDVFGFRAALSDDGSGGLLAHVSALASDNDAILAINGDDYGAHKYGVIIRNGALLRAHTTTRNMLAIDSEGNMTVTADRNDENSKALGKKMIADGVWQSFEFGPELVRDGQAATFNPAFDVISTDSSRLEPRTAIGQIAPLHYILIVVDGRQDGYSVGMSLQDLQQLFIRFGAQTAMNLDGGGSTELWFQGSVINQPSGGVERSVSDIIYF